MNNLSTSSSPAVRWESPYGIFSRGGSPSENLSTDEIVKQQMAKFAEYTAKEESSKSPTCIDYRHTPSSAERSKVKVEGRVAPSPTAPSSDWTAPSPSQRMSGTLSLTAGSFVPVSPSREVVDKAKVEALMDKFAKYTAKEEGLEGGASLLKRSFSVANINSNP